MGGFSDFLNVASSKSGGLTPCRQLRLSSRREYVYSSDTNGDNNGGNIIRT